ncbi:MAG: hypothetical protein KGI84_08840 [Elusimicrobia bacterium]|nr:hypothetical protein [Elusimicrobiota bacterium]
MSEQTHGTLSPWEGAEIIHAYTRAQAIEDGVLADVSDLAREAGFKWPVAVTSLVWAFLEPSEDLKDQGQSWTGRAWDMLTILRHAIRTAERTDEVRFAPLFVLEPGRDPQPVQLRAKCGPGDNGEPVITVMMPEGED